MEQQFFEPIAALPAESAVLIIQISWLSNFDPFCFNIFEFLLLLLKEIKHCNNVAQAVWKLTYLILLSLEVSVSKVANDLVEIPVADPA